MLYEILKHLHNFFHVRGAGRSGMWKVEDGTMILPFLKEGQYYQIEGSVLNDGVYRYPASGMRDEEFVGFVSPMAIPSEVITLCQQITEWCEEHEESLQSEYQSESFGGYTYTKATDKNGNLAGWQDVFRKRLNAWRKI